MQGRRGVCKPALALSGYGGTGPALAFELPRAGISAWPQSGGGSGDTP
jgi:hypothetical protein